MRNLKTVLSIFVALSLVAGVAFAAPTVVKPTEPYAGMTYGDWSAAWWQYVTQAPYDEIFNDEDCTYGQGDAPVFFLVGGGSKTSTATRTCTVPRGKAIFFPIINAECSTVEPPPWLGGNEHALRICASKFGNATLIDSLKVTVDGAPLTNLKNMRVQSPVFTFTSVAGSIIGVAETGLSASDGYWILLNPLSPGKHTIHFEGVGSAEDINDSSYENYQNVTYELTVQ